VQRKFNEFFGILEHQVKQKVDPPSYSSSSLLVPSCGSNNHPGNHPSTPDQEEEQEVSDDVEFATDDDIDFDESGSQDIPLPLETIRQVAQSGFLTSKELGHFLLLSSPLIPSHLGKEFIWSCLCHSKFPELMTMSSCSVLLPRHKYSHEWIFRQFSKSISDPSSSTNWPPLSPPSLQPENLAVIVQWYDQRANLTPSATILIPPNQLSEFLEQGQVTVPAPPNLFFTITDMHKIHLKVHCVRLDRKECCCVHETGECTWDPNPHRPALLDEPYWNDQSSGNLYLGPRMPVLLETSGRDLETRLARGNREAGGFEVLAVASANYHVQKQHWSVNQVELQFWANYSDELYIYKTAEHTRKHGVTLLHILDQLQGWKD
jgi:hypothetical protein